MIASRSIVGNSSQRARTKILESPRSTGKTQPGDSTPPHDGRFCGTPSKGQEKEKKRGPGPRLWYVSRDAFSHRRVGGVNTTVFVSRLNAKGKGKAQGTYGRFSPIHVDAGVVRHALHPGCILRFSYSMFIGREKGPVRDETNLRFSHRDSSGVGCGKGKYVVEIHPILSRRRAREGCDHSTRRSFMT